MTRWRPAPTIRFKAIGLHWRGDRLLAAEVTDDAGRLKGVRPLGGSVEFGETAQGALVREFHEELGVPVTIKSPPFFIENIYHHEGNLGHELLAVFDVSFPQGAYDHQDRIAFTEHDGYRCHAEWFALDTLDLPNGPKLFPDGLKTRLLGSC
ncbi:MAG: NUDIX hydrolase [Roseobacter sp.]